MTWRSVFFGLLISTNALGAAPVRVGGGYYGDIVTHPGAYANVAWEVAEAGAVTILLGGDLGGYQHRRNHTGAFARGSFGTRVGGSSGLFDANEDNAYRLIKPLLDNPELTDRLDEITAEVAHSMHEEDPEAFVAVSGLVEGLR